MALKKVGLAFVADNGDLFIRTLDKVNDASDNVNKKMGPMARTMNKAFADISRGAKEHLGHTLVDTAFQAGAAVGDFVLGSADAAGKFETTMNRFESVAGSSLQASGQSIADFDALFMKLGADTQFSAQQAGDAAIELAKGGRSANQVFKELDDTLALASAGEVDLAQAAELSAKQLAIWENTGVSSAEVADLLAQAANASTVGVGDLGLGLANVGGVAKVAGLSFEETVQTLAQLAPGFSSASDAGTSFKAFLNNLQPTTDPATKAMKDLGLYTEETGSKFYDAQGNFVGMEQASQLLYDATKDLSQAQRAQALETIFGSDAQRAAAIIAEGGAKSYLAMGEAMGKAGSATDQANKKNKGYAFQLETLKGSLETLQITLGRLVIGPMTGFVEKLTQTANGLTTIVGYIDNLTSSTEKSEDSFSLWSAAMNAVPLGPLSEDLRGMNDDLQRIAKNDKVIAGTIMKGFGGLQGLLDGATASLRQTKIATGELGAQGQLTTDELAALAKELEGINEAGSKAAQDVLQTDVAYLTESRDRRAEHYAKLRELNQAYRNAETDDQRAAIDKQRDQENTAYSQSQRNADIAYARQRAAQQAHLGEMLINWVNTQIAMGAITAEQGDKINETIATKFGVAADNTALLFGDMTREIQKTVDTKGDINALGDSLVGLQTSAANTQVKINQMEQQAFAKLKQELKDGKLTLEEYTQKILEVPKEVRTKVEITGGAEAKQEAIGMGYAISSGMAEGVRKGKGEIAGAVNEAIAAAYAAGRQTAQIQSPSKLFERGVGAPIMEGVAVGMERQSGLLATILGRVEGSIYSRLAAMADAVSSYAPSGGSSWGLMPTAPTSNYNPIGGGYQIAAPATPSQIATTYQNSYTHAPVVNYAPTYNSPAPPPATNYTQAAALANML